jgi:hypothetical protein
VTGVPAGSIIAHHPEKEMQNLMPDPYDDLARLDRSVEETISEDRNAEMLAMIACQARLPVSADLDDEALVMAAWVTVVGPDTQRPAAGRLSSLRGTRA